MTKAIPITNLNDKEFFVDEKLLQLRNTQDPNDVIQFETIHGLREYRFWSEQMQFIVGKRVIRAEMVHDDDMDAKKPVLIFEDGQRREPYSCDTQCTGYGSSRPSVSPLGSMR